MHAVTRLRALKLKHMPPAIVISQSSYRTMYKLAVIVLDRPNRMANDRKLICAPEFRVSFMRLFSVFCALSNLYCLSVCKVQFPFCILKFREWWYFNEMRVDQPSKAQFGAGVERKRAHIPLTSDTLEVFAISFKISGTSKSALNKSSTCALTVWFHSSVKIGDWVSEWMNEWVLERLFVSVVASCFACRVSLRHSTLFE